MRFPSERRTNSTTRTTTMMARPAADHRHCRATTMLLVMAVSVAVAFVTHLHVSVLTKQHRGRLALAGKEEAVGGGGSTTSAVTGTTEGGAAAAASSSRTTMLVHTAGTTTAAATTGADRNGSIPSAISTTMTNSKDGGGRSGSIVGIDGGAWTAETHLTQYGFNVDAGLVRILEASCRAIENARNGPDSQWSAHPSQDSPIGGLWRPPAVVDCTVLELGSGVGVYVDALKKDQAKRNRRVYGVEPNRMGGVYERRNGPRQLAVDIMATDDPVALAKAIMRDALPDIPEDGGGFDLLYSIEVCEHLPPDRHVDAATFLATLARPGTKLIFGAAHNGQGGTGHIGNRAKSEWETILSRVGFVKHQQETLAVAHELDEYNHKVNTQVYYYQPPVVDAK